MGKTLAKNNSGVSDASLAAINASLDDLDLDLAGGDIVEQIDDVLEAQPEEIVVMEDEPNQDEVLIEAIEEIVEGETVEDTTEEIAPIIEAEAETPAPVVAADAIDDLNLDISEADLAEIEAKAERLRIYEQQSSETSIETVGASSEDLNPTVTEPKVKKPRKAKAAGTGATGTKVVKDVNALSPAIFALTKDVTDFEAAKIEVLATRPSQVKVAEKFDNLFTSLAAGKAPSVYVMTAFEALDVKKTITAKEIAAAYKASGHTDGTANSQAGQIMNLFHTVKIADRAKNSLTLREDSVLAVMMRDLVKAKASA